MANKQKYEGKLAEPLPSHPSPLDEDEEAKLGQYNDELAARFDLLFDHYGIDKSGPNRWQGLAFELMRAHVPGFQEYQAPRPVDTDRFVRIVFNIEYIRRKHGVSLNQASKELARVAPGLGTQEAIRSYYREVEKSENGAPLLRFLDRVATGVGKAVLLNGLEGALEPEVENIREIEPSSLGRPTKK